MSSEPILLAELHGYTDAGVYTVHRFSTAPYCTRWNDVPADAHYEPRLIDPGYMSQELPGLRSDGRATVGVGAARIQNLDGALDGVFGVSGISFRERMYYLREVQPDAAYSTATLLLAARISQVSMTRAEVTVSLKDGSYVYDSPHLTATYGGTNVLPAGVDGTADIAGKLKPRIMGTVFGVSPVCVNTSKLIYQVSDGAVQSIQPYDGGSTITLGADYASQADMEANTPAAGTARVWKAGGMFRLETKPTYQPTADVVADLAADSTPAQLIKRLALARGTPAGDISAADVAAVDALANVVCGLNITDATHTAALMSQVAVSKGLSWFKDDFDVLRIQQFGEASGEPEVLIGEHNCKDVVKLTDGEDVPTLDVRVRYAQYHTTLRAGQAATSLTAAQLADLGERWRVAQHTGVISPNPHARTQQLEVDTCLTTQADAAAEAARRYAVMSVPRRSHQLQAFGTEAWGARIGGVVGLLWPRYGFSNEAPTLRRVRAITKRYGAPRRVDITAWGS